MQGEKTEMKKVNNLGVNGRIFHARLCKTFAPQ